MKRFGLLTQAVSGLMLLVACSDDPVPTGTAATPLSAVATNGTEISPGENIQARVNSAPEGTAFTLKSGVHRLQSVTPKNGMSFTGEPGAIISGARLLTDFTQEGGYWVASGQTQQGRVYGNCLPEYPRCSYPEDLFIDDVLLRHVASLGEVGPGKWYFDYAADKIYFADNPAGRKVEVSVTPRAFQGTASSVTIRGLIIEKYATPNAEGTIHGYTGTDWLVEGNEVRWNHGGGIRTGTRMVARRNNTHHNGQYGFSGTGSDKRQDVLVEDNVIAYNNTTGVNPQWGAGGSKWHNTRNLVLRRNSVHHNKGTGLWADINNIYTLIEYNTVENNTRNGIFYEISYDAKIRYNTCRGNGFDNTATLRGGGIAVTSSPKVEIYGNTVEGNRNGIIVNQDARGSGAYGPYEVEHLDVHDNIVKMTTGYTGFNVQGTDLSYYTKRNNRFARNTYYLGSNAQYFFWQKAPRTKEEWQAYKQDINGTFLPHP